MISKVLLPELDYELPTTRRLLERVPEEKAGFKPHPKSYSLGNLALHVATIPLWGAYTMRETELDPNALGLPPRKFESTAALLAMFDENAKAAREAVAAASDDDFKVPWTLKNGGQVVITMPRAAVIRSFVLNHLIHHRGQLSVYLRMSDVELPSIYGPTADTK